MSKTGLDRIGIENAISCGEYIEWFPVEDGTNRETNVFHRLDGANTDINL